MRDLADTHVSAIADDDVVEHVDAAPRAGGREMPCERPIVWARRRIAARVDMGDDHGGRVRQDGALNTSRGWTSWSRACLG